jgi:UDP-3-O-[3-hydroxymyristoyl] glucosamine N-acyltransferase
VTLAELASRIGCRLEGDGTLDVRRVSTLEAAGPGDVTFLHNPRYAGRVATTRASAVIADDTLARAPCAILRTAQPYVAFADAVTLLSNPTRPAPGVSPLAAIDPSADVGAGVSIAAFVSIGPRARIGPRVVLEPHVVIGPDAVIGADSLLRAHVSVRDGVVIGERVILHDGAVIGSDGYGFARRADGTHQKIPQVGAVVIEDDVEIGALCAVDRPAIGETRIGRGTKLDNLVQIAHGVRLGRNVLMAAQSGIAGSSRLGDDVTVAGQAGISGHLEVGAGAKIGAKSVVTKDVPDGRHVVGIPAVERDQWRQAVALVRRLPELRRTVAALEARLAALEPRAK